MIHKYRGNAVWGLTQSIRPGSVPITVGLLGKGLYRLEVTLLKGYDLLYWSFCSEGESGGKRAFMRLPMSWEINIEVNARYYLYVDNAAPRCDKNTSIEDYYEKYTSEVVLSLWPITRELDHLPSW